MANRRSVLIGLGGLVAGGGALLGTGAFTTVEAERTVSVETTDDAQALLAFEPAGANSPYVDDSGDTIQINLDGNEDGDADAAGLNQNAVTTFADLVQVTNNGTQAVTSLSFTIGVSETDNDDAHESAFSIYYDDTAHSADGTNILDNNLEVGDPITFGVEIDLLNHGISEISPDAEYTLTINAGTE